MRNFEQVLKLEPGRTAPLVVDMQRGFVDPGEALEVPQARRLRKLDHRRSTARSGRAA